MTSFRAAAVSAALLAGAVAVAGCSVLGLDSQGPVDATVQTSAARAAPVETPSDAVSAPELVTGTTSPRPSPTPWKSRLETTTPTTTTEAPLTAPTTTNTLTFWAPSSVTAPDISAPTAVKSPPPDCFAGGDCPPVASATVGSGTVDIVTPPGADSTVAVWSPGGTATSAVTLGSLASPKLSCVGSYCLVQGSSSGVHLGTMVHVSGKTIKGLAGAPTSATTLRLVGSASAPVVAGSQRMTDYGLLGSEAPVAAHTWAVSGGKLVSTGCSAPRLFASAPAVTSAQRGACSGTPRIAGYGSASAHKIVSLGGFVTPSGNIACAIVSTRLTCTAKQHSFSVKTCSKSTTAVPKELRGLRVSVHPGGTVAHDDCIGYDLIGAPATKISYNRLAVGNGFVCEVQKSGVTCTNAHGKGFTLSRASLKRV